MAGIKNILLVDDDNTEHVFFTRALKSSGLNITCSSAHSADGAIDMLEHNKIPLPDIVFLDLNMPGHNGKYGLQALKHSSKFSEIPVVMFTSGDVVIEKEVFSVLGADYLLQKPPLEKLTLVLKYIGGAELTDTEIEQVEKIMVKVD